MFIKINNLNEGWVIQNHPEKGANGSLLLPPCGRKKTKQRNIPFCLATDV